MSSRKINVIETICTLICIIMLFVFWGAVHAFASEPTVYVAGNANMYPIEYYDDKTGQYAGLMPQLYRVLSEKTGYTFQYLNANGIGAQERLAKNGQADIISAYLQGTMDEQYIKAPQFISDITIDGRQQRICFAFSNIASDEIISKVSAAFSEISMEQKLSLLSSHTMEYGGVNRIYKLLVYVLGGILSVILLIAAALAVHFLKKRKAALDNVMMHPDYGIGNDKYYIYCYDNLISDKSKSLYYLAYIAFDEETFNQRYGKTESQMVQQYVAAFLNQKTGAAEYLALVNAGVFALLYQSSNKPKAEERIRHIMDELDTYLNQFKSDYTDLFSAGVCALEENMDCGSEAAFYNAKQGYLHATSRKLKFSFSTQNIVAETHQNERLRHRITQAIQDGEFQLYLQYIVDRDGKICGAEAVSRWQNPQEGLLPPSKYIELIGQTGAMTAHDYYIFSQACKQLEKWTMADMRHMYISCNFTRYSITASDFPAHIKEIADRYTFLHSHFIIEVTEDSLSHNPKHLRENLQKCKSFGFRIALDDLGSGYSSLSDLFHYPIDIVKVDRDIVLNAMDKRGKMLLDGLVRLAHSMNITVLCEGIETEEHNNMVLSTDCDLIQGYYYSRVLPLKEAEKFLKEHGQSSAEADKTL